VEVSVVLLGERSRRALALGQQDARMGPDVTLPVLSGIS
jgi:hypothetical protein